VAHHGAGRDDIRAGGQSVSNALHPRRRCQQPDPPDSNLGAARCGHDARFNGDVERALRSIKVPLLYMPSETDLYFPIGDARYEAAFIPGVSLTPSIPWGHTAGAASNPTDAKFLNENIGRFLH